MKRIVITLLFLFPFTIIYSQNFPAAYKLFEVNILTSMEGWNGTTNSDFSELSTILNLKYSPLRKTNISISSRYASITGDIKKLNGLSDVQLFISHEVLENLSLNAGLNLPSGKTKLEPDEFNTTRIISQNLFNINTSNFGQGLNYLFGTAYTLPVSDNFVLGAGVSYQIKNEYQPLISESQKYKPSNEFSLTAGFDIKLNEQSTFTADLTSIFYGSDEVDGKEIFTTGDRIVFSSIYKHYFGYNLLSFLLYYRAINKGEINNVNTVVEIEKINPNQLYCGVIFNHRISSIVRLKYGAAINSYEKTSLEFSGYTLYELSLNPEFKLSQNVSLPLILKYAFGNAEGKNNLTNYEFGAGLLINL